MTLEMEKARPPPPPSDKQAGVYAVDNIPFISLNEHPETMNLGREKL